MKKLKCTELLKYLVLMHYNSWHMDEWKSEMSSVAQKHFVQPVVGLEDLPILRDWGMMSLKIPSPHPSKTAFQISAPLGPYVNWSRKSLWPEICRGPGNKIRSTHPRTNCYHYHAISYGPRRAVLKVFSPKVGFFLFLVQVMLENINLGLVFPHWHYMQYWKTSIWSSLPNFGDENFWYVPPDTPGNVLFGSQFVLAWVLRISKFGPSGHSLKEKDSQTDATGHSPW